MKNGIFLKTSLVCLILTVFAVLVTKIYIEPRFARQLKTILSNGLDYTIDIKNINIDIFRSKLELESVKINFDQKQKGYSGEIGSVKFNGINIIKAVLKHDIYVEELTIFKSSLYREIPSGRPVSPILSPLKISIGRLLFDQFNLEMENDSSGQKYSVKNGFIRIYGLHFSKMDTISSDIITLFDFEAGELNIISSDKMYSYLMRGFNYSATLNALSVDSLFISPKYKDYDFTSRFKFQENCIEASISKIKVHDFYVDNHFNPMNLESSYVEIGELNMKIFRDMRKELHHEKKPVFQDMIYNISSVVRIDSISLMRGKITYKVHAEESKEPGILFINEISARLINLTNDTLYKTKSGSLELAAEARLMGNGKLAILLKGKIFDKNNSFSLNGSLMGLDVSELNPILENNAFIYASGKIDAMNFSFVADNVKAKGKMTMLYHGLNIKVKDKRFDDTTSLKARFFSYMANRRILDSNPVKAEKVRIGIIDFERDPERFLFHYCFRSILTGISSTLSGNDKKSRRIVAEKN